MIKRIRAVFAACFVAGTIFAGAPASAVPAVCVMPTSGTVSGLTLVQDINNCYGAALGLFAGGSAPGSPTNGMLWWNTSSGQVAQYDGTGWNNLWTVDTTNHLNAVQIGGGVQATVASAGVTDLWSVAASSVSVTGAASITQLANADAVPGTLKVVTFAGAATLTQGGGSGGAPLNLPNNGSNVVTAPGDYAIVLALTSTNVQVIHYERASGAALSTAGLNVGASALAQSAQGYGAPINLQLAAAVSGNNLTVTVLGVNGSNPSSTNPVLVNFRSQTLNNGSNGIVYGQITGALSFQVTSGNTMGCTTAVVCRLWVTLICRTEFSGDLHRYSARRERSIDHDAGLSAGRGRAADHGRGHQRRRHRGHDLSKHCRHVRRGDQNRRLCRGDLAHRHRLGHDAEQGAGVRAGRAQAGRRCAARLRANRQRRVHWHQFCGVEYHRVYYSYECHQPDRGQRHGEFRSSIGRGHYGTNSPRGIDERWRGLCFRLDHFGHVEQRGSPF